MSAKPKPSRTAAALARTMLAAQVDALTVGGALGDTRAEIEALAAAIEPDSARLRGIAADLQAAAMRVAMAGLTLRAAAERLALVADLEGGAS
ncbi:MAG TPA: hypothetical protein VGM29_10390 [Polyangiaceae bacterium]|jgi:hypothetical protein